MNKRLALITADVKTEIIFPVFPLSFRFLPP